MNINLADIARGRRIVATTAREMTILKTNKRPAPPSILKKVVRRLKK